MLFHYSAVEASGRIAEADYEADTVDQVLQYLSGRQLRPLAVTPIKERSRKLISFGGGISTTDKVFLTKYLALMLRVNTDLLTAVNILISDFDKAAVREFLLEVRENLTHGQPFWKAFSAHPAIFSPTFVNLVKSAELSGNLQKTFEDLSVITQRDAEMKSRIRSAMIYPIVLLTAATGIIVFLTTYALPKVAGVFTQSGIQPPTFSRITFAIGLFIGGHVVSIFVVIIVLVAFLTWFTLKTEAGRRGFQRALASLPVVKDIYQKLALQRMASTMSSLLKAGLPVVETLQVSADTVGYRDFQLALLRIANDGISKGLTIGEAFRRETVFPKTVTNLIAISEQAGHLEEVLDTLSNFYVADIDGSLQTLMSLIEPVLVLIMGVMVAVIALSIIVPVYQLTTQF